MTAFRSFLRKFHFLIWHILPKPALKYYPQIRAILESGDLVVVKSPIEITPGFWSHVGVYVGALGGADELVVEARHFGVHALPLKKMMETRYASVLRPELPVSERRIAAQRALGMIGKHFDFTFRFDDDSCLSCIEVPFVLYGERLGIELRTMSIFGINKRAILPDDLFIKGFKTIWISPNVDSDVMSKYGGG